MNKHGSDKTTPKGWHPNRTFPKGRKIDEPIEHINRPRTQAYLKYHKVGPYKPTGA